MAVPVATNDQIVDELIQLPFDKVDFIKLILKFVEKEQKVGFTEFCLNFFMINQC